VDFQDFLASVPVGNGNRDFPVEPPRAAQGRVQGVGQVGGRQNDHVFPLRQSVHQRQQLRHHALLHVADHALPPRGDGVDFVEENNARRALGRLVEEFAQMGLALAVELVDDLRPVDRKEVGIGFMGHRSGQERLAAAGRTVEQNALGGVDPQTLEQLRVFQRQLDDFPHAVQRALQSADVFVRERSRGRRRLIFAGLHFQQRIRRDANQSGGTRGFHQEIGAAVSKQGDPHAIARGHRQAVEQAADVLQVAARRDAALRNQQEFLGRLDGSPANDRRFIEPDAGVFADNAVDLEMLLAAVLLERGQDPADGPPLALHFEHVAYIHAKALHVRGVDACNPPADVLAGRLADPERDFLVEYGRFHHLCLSLIVRGGS
jgi:hypothetical protein